MHRDDQERFFYGHDQIVSLLLEAVNGIFPVTVIRISHHPEPPRAAFRRHLRGFFRLHVCRDSTERNDEFEKRERSFFLHVVAASATRQFVPSGSPTSSYGFHLLHFVGVLRRQGVVVQAPAVGVPPRLEAVAPRRMERPDRGGRVGHIASAPSRGGECERQSDKAGEREAHRELGFCANEGLSVMREMSACLGMRSFDREQRCQGTKGVTSRDSFFSEFGFRHKVSG